MAIGVDTNVLARLFVIDNEAQHARAVRFFGERSPEDPAFVTLVVVAELVWLLEKRLKFARSRVLELMQAMLETVDIDFEEREVVVAALAQAARPEIDIADILIMEVSRRGGCEKVVTFDKPAAKHIPGMELLA